MNNNTIQIKVKQRLNKLDSKDYDNLEPWMIQEAFNKAQREWIRRQLHGNNLYKESNEQTIRRVDDLQIILKEYELNGGSTKLYFESGDLPKDFFEYKRISMDGSNDKCSNRRFKVYLAEEANRDILLDDELNRPDFGWAETFFTFINNKVRIYTDDKFTVSKAVLVYYRQPREVKFVNTIDLDTGSLNTIDVICEFKDDIVELIIDETASILAGDIESQQMNRNTTSAERNN